MERRGGAVPWGAPFSWRAPRHFFPTAATGPRWHPNPVYAQSPVQTLTSCPLTEMRHRKKSGSDRTFRKIWMRRQDMYGISLARLVAAGFCGLAANVLAADTIKIAHIDPQSGPFALQGQSGDRHIQQAIDEINARGGVLGGIKLELVSLDNKSSPQESLVALKQAIDQAIRFVTQGNGSHVGQ